MPTLYHTRTLFTRNLVDNCPKVKPRLFSFCMSEITFERKTVTAWTWCWTSYKTKNVVLKDTNSSRVPKHFKNDTRSVQLVLAPPELFVPRTLVKPGDGQRRTGQGKKPEYVPELRRKENENNWNENYFHEIGLSFDILNEVEKTFSAIRLVKNKANISLQQRSLSRI